MLALVFGLASSLCWGSADFLGGLTTRRATLWAVVIGQQATGLATIVLLVALTGRPFPGFDAAWPALLGGIAACVAIGSLYKALAIGTMSIVAPISATSVVIPFLVGIGGGERPSSVQLIGVALAAASVLLTVMERSREDERIGAAALPGEPAIEPQVAAAHRPSRPQNRRAILLSLVSAVGIGLMLLGFDATAEHDALWAVVCSRASSASCFTLAILMLRPHIGLPGAALPGIIGAGLFDVAANVCFSLATTQGYLSLVGVLGSVYPVVTVILAFVFLRERLQPHQLAGAIGTLVGVALIAAS